MVDSLLSNSTELGFLWKRRGKKHYDLKSFISNGAFMEYMIFQDVLKNQPFVGKIVTSPREGEAYHWPRLQHKNLAPLEDIVSINEKISIYILPAIGRNIKIIIHGQEFMADPQCFNRKRSYAEDVLWALDYLHSKSLCIMNLTELIVRVCEVTDKAIICDFSCVILKERIKKENINLPALYLAPELKTREFNPVAVETWACGVVFLQIFTGHALPFAFLGDEVGQVLQAVKEINYDILKEANPAAEIDSLTIEDLRSFLNMFLVENPMLRVNVQCAAVSSFLGCSKIYANKASDDLASSNIDNKNFVTTVRSNQTDSRLEIKKSETFKDIYLKEVASYRDKLKNLPCTNKFINLEFVPDGDSISKQPEQNHHTSEKSNVETVKDKEKSFLNDKSSDEPVLQHLMSRKSPRDDTSEFQKGDAEKILETPTSTKRFLRRPDMLSGYLVDGTLKHADSAKEYGSGSTNHLQRTQLDEISFKEKNQDEIKHLDAKSLTDTDCSTNLQIPFESRKENNFDEFGLTCQVSNNTKGSIKSEVEIGKLFAEDKAQSFASQNETKSEGVGMNACTTNKKDDEEDIQSSALTSSYSYSRDESSKIITILDSSKLTITPVDYSPDYNWSSCGAKETQSTDISDANHSEVYAISQNHAQEEQADQKIGKDLPSASKPETAVETTKTGTDTKKKTSFLKTLFTYKRSRNVKKKAKGSGNVKYGEQSPSVQTNGNTCVRSSASGSSVPISSSSDVAKSVSEKAKKLDKRRNWEKYLFCLRFKK